MTAEPTVAVPVSDRIVVPPPDTPDQCQGPARVEQPSPAAATAPTVEETLLNELRQLREAAARRSKNWTIAAVTALILAVIAAIAVPTAVHVHHQHEAKDRAVQCLTDAITADTEGLSTSEFNLQYPQCAIG